MHGLYLLWWVQEKQMSPAVVAAILAAGDVSLMCLELPACWFADRVGHRASLILGSVVQIAGMLWCWLGAGVSGLVIASVLVALADAFRSARMRRCSIAPAACSIAKRLFRQSRHAHTPWSSARSSDSYLPVA